MGWAFGCATLVIEVLIKMELIVILSLLINILTLLLKQEVFLQIVRALILTMQVCQYVSQGFLGAAHLAIYEVPSIEELFQGLAHQLGLQHLRTFLVLILGKHINQVAEETDVILLHYFQHVLIYTLLLC